MRYKCTCPSCNYSFEGYTLEIESISTEMYSKIDIQKLQELITKAKRHIHRCSLCSDLQTKDLTVMIKEEI